MPPASKTAFVPPPVPAPMIPSPKASLALTSKPFLVNAVVPVCSTADCKLSVTPSSMAPLAVLPTFIGILPLAIPFSFAMFCAP